ncbi:hypothetical protein NUW58_g1787 [Xylaria curta]|uniref:Uncharacterized protein n=1 Tax=Xylaria curta TaxID=42375 RepID=A0ACC1PKQ5_9PEZI|nr:hypothetical protein NUW58_g1787 [Xylaria curta]
MHESDALGRGSDIRLSPSSATNVCDSKLPLDNESLSQASAAGQGLSEKERELFENAQWQIRSHYLTGSGVDEPGVVKLDDGAVLPLMKRRDIRKGRASGSKEAKPIPVFPEDQVTEIEIHPDHHDLHKMNGKSNIFVLKTFRHPRDPEIAEEDFKAELLANRQLPRHERIVPLLAAFEFENEFHLIFPFARQGDLESLWERTKMLPKDPLPGWYSPQWLLRECLGIVEALAETHSPTLPTNEAGSIVWVPQLHADIKARNILCFQPNDQAPPLLKLADFGCSQRAGEDGAFNINGGLPHTKTYRPPERDMENFVGLNYDVWCLGCLYLDFITWAIIGYKGIEDFNESRMEEKNDKYVSKARGNDAEDIFFKKLARLPRWYDASALRFQSQRTEKLYKNTAFAQRSFTFSRGVIKISCDIKISVIQHINTLQVNGQCQPEFQKLLEIIENDMLVVERQKRASSSKIKSLLQEVVRPIQRCKVINNVFHSDGLPFCENQQLNTQATYTKMQWIGRTKKLSGGDLDDFKFIQGHPCATQTIRLCRDASGSVEVVEKHIHESEPEYLRWIDQQSRSWTYEPTLILVMYQRLELADTKATHLPIGKSTFLTACDRFCQHRSIADAIRRKAPATFTRMTVAAWKDRLDWGPAVVYICKSDTISPVGMSGMVLSVTHFPKRSIILAVAYGCTAENRQYIEDWLEYAKTFAFDPLVLPMIWAQLERERLINKVDRKAADLRKRIIDMNNRLAHNGLSNRKSSQSDDSHLRSDSIEMLGGGGTTTQKHITQRECDAVNLWVDVSTLKNGLEASGQSSRSPPERDKVVPGKEQPDQISIHAYTDSLLGGMTLATQTESNHLSRRDALTNIFIAVESKKDSSHMRYIAFLGMIFLPGTFFATLFSMTFFNWIPNDSDQVVSPWVVVYFGFTAVSTAGTLWRFHTWAKRRDAEAELSVTTKLENYPGTALLLPLSHDDTHLRQSERV